MYSILLLLLGVKELNGGEEMTEDENVSTDDEDFNNSDEPSGKKRITNKQFSKNFGELDIIYS